MSRLPPSPFITETAAASIPHPAAVEAVAPVLPPEGAAAALSLPCKGGPEEASAVAASNTTAAGATDLLDSDISNVGEVFHYIRQLIREDNAMHRRFVLDEARFADEIEEPPMFLRAAE